MLGANGSWEEVDALGIARFTPGSRIRALEEAITVVRALACGGEPGMDMTTDSPSVRQQVIDELGRQMASVGPAPGPVRRAPGRSGPTGRVVGRLGLDPTTGGL